MSALNVGARSGLLQAATRAAVHRVTPISSRRVAAPFQSASFRTSAPSSLKLQPEANVEVRLSSAGAFPQPPRASSVTIRRPAMHVGCRSGLLCRGSSWALPQRCDADPEDQTVARDKPLGLIAKRRGLRLIAPRDVFTPAGHSRTFPICTP